MDFSNVPDLSMLAAQRKKEEIFGFDITDLQPSERIVIMELMTWANDEYRKTLETSSSLRNDLLRYSLMVDEKFRENGWCVFVDAFNVEVDADDNPYLSAVINITGRASEVEFDFEQAKGETQHGLADGIVGRVNEQGKWLDPKTVI